MARSPSTESAEPAGFDVREFARTAHGSLRDDLDLASLAEAPLPAGCPRRARGARRARGRHDGAPAQRARHAHAQGRAGHGVPRHVGVREVLDRGCAPCDRRCERRSVGRRARGRSAQRRYRTRRPAMPHGCPTPNRSARHPAAAAPCGARSRASRRAGRSSGRTWRSGSSTTWCSAPPTPGWSSAPRMPRCTPPSTGSSP